MGGRVSALKDTKVVIVGSGYAGQNLAGRLKKVKAPFTVVDPRDFFHHNVAAVRAVSEPGMSNGQKGKKNNVLLLKNSRVGIYFLSFHFKFHLDLCKLFHVKVPFLPF